MLQNILIYIECGNTVICCSIIQFTIDNYYRQVTANVSADAGFCGLTLLPVHIRKQ